MNRISKVTYIVGTIVNIVIGFVGIACAIYIYNNPFLSVDKEITKQQAIKQCTDMLRNNQFHVEASMKNGIIEVTHEDLNHWQTSIAKMSYVFQSCQAMEMVSFCMGSECKTSKNYDINGIVSTLSYTPPIENK